MAGVLGWMRSHRWVGVVLLILVVAWLIWTNAPTDTLVTSVPSAPPPPAGVLPWVSTFNHRMVDDQGRYLTLHGFNQDSLVDWPSWPPAPLDDTDAQLMQQAGFNVVRLPISWSLIEPTRGQIDSAYLDRVQQTVDMLNRHGLYVVLDMHFSLDWSPRFGGVGAPDWAVVPNIPTGIWQPPNTSWKVSPGILAANTYFWTQTDWQQDFDQSWQAVAMRFKDDPGVVGYDLYNEPQSTPMPPHLFEEAWMWPTYVRAINAIGQVDSHHLFMVEGILLWNFPTTMDHVLAPNMVFAFHVYTGALVPPEYDIAPDWLPRSIDTKNWEAQQIPATSWAGEMGIDLSKPFALAWMDAALAKLDSLQIGWAWWQWRDIPTWGIRARDGSSLNTDVLKHLALPYLANAPAGVTARDADGIHGNLDIDVAPNHPNQPVDVAWSALTLPAPRVAGSCVASSSWDATTARIHLTLQPGRACTVAITASAS